MFMFISWVFFAIIKDKKFLRNSVVLNVTAKHKLYKFCLYYLKYVALSNNISFEKKEDWTTKKNIFCLLTIKQTFSYTFFLVGKQVNAKREDRMNLFTKKNKRKKIAEFHFDSSLFMIEKKYRNKTSRLWNRIGVSVVSGISNRTHRFIRCIKNTF